MSKKSCSSTGSGSSRRTSCSHKLRYRYVVNGESREGYRLRFGVFRKTIEARVKQYPKGKKVRVFYRSTEPSLSVLEPGTSHIEPLVGAYIPLLLGLGISAPLLAWRGSYQLGRMRRRWRQRRSRPVAS